MLNGGNGKLFLQLYIRVCHKLEFTVSCFCITLKHFVYSRNFEFNLADIFRYVVNAMVESSVLCLTLERILNSSLQHNDITEFIISLSLSYHSIIKVFHESFRTKNVNRNSGCGSLPEDLRHLCSHQKNTYVF